MLRRHSLKGLDRRKSTSSTHSKYESMDPEIAHQYAHTAAVLAYTRALDRNSADVGHRAGGPQRSNASQDHQFNSQQTSTASVIDHGVRRQRSVRFAGPNAVQRRQPVAARATGAILQPKSSTLTLRPIAMTTNAPVPAAYRPPSRSSSIGKASFGRATAASFIAGSAFDEYYTREDDVASTPSSYRRIRKSKSMFSPLKAPSVFYTNGSPDMQEHIYDRDIISNTKTNQISASQTVLRAPKSMSFLRNNRNREQPEKNDKAVRIARDRFFHETAQQRLREQPSFIFRSRAQKQEKPFRKSVRCSSGGYGLPVASGEDQDQPTKESGLRGVARKASQTIRKKFKRVFGRGKDEPISIPDQQVDARETHVRKYNGDLPEDYTDIPRPDEASLSSVATRNPLLHAINSSQRLRSFAGSVKSVQSPKSDHSDERSRVTSWTSTGVNTVASQPIQAPVDRNQQRLSIIDEVGAHIPSSSFRQSILEAQFFGHPPLASASRSDSNILTPPLQKQVDSARVYSALMKRLDENSPKSKLEASQKVSKENSMLQNYTPRSQKLVEASPGSPNSRTPATIRHIISSGSTEGRNQRSISHNHQWVKCDSISSAKAENMFGHTGSHVHQWTNADPLREARMRSSDDVFSFKNGSPKKSCVRSASSSSNKENMPPSENFLDRTRSTVTVSALSPQASTKTSYHTVPENFGLTPQELALQNEPIVQEKQKLRDSRSTFFGGTSVTIARATSPYRRAMADAEFGSLTNKNPPLSATPFLPYSSYPAPDITLGEKFGHEKSFENAYSESIYSRTTSGHLAGTGSVISLPFDNSQHPECLAPDITTDGVTILDRSVYRPTKPSSGHLRGNDSMGSTEWKKWMSSEVAKLERAKENPTNSSYVNYTLPTMPRSFHLGHFRESAQIYEDDSAHVKAPIAKQPLGIARLPNANIQNPPILKPILKKQSTSSLAENAEPKFSPRSRIPVPPPPPPPIPARSPLRVMPSRASLRSQNTVNTPNSANKMAVIGTKNVLHKRNTSQGTLSVKSANISTKSLETPAKLVKRNRPSYSNASTPISLPGDGFNGRVEEMFRNITPIEQFRSPRDSHLISSREQMRWEMMQRDERDRQRRESDINGIDGSGLLDPIMGVSRGGISRPASELGRRESIGRRKGVTEEDLQVKGSRMMVDLFLSSRRRRIAGGSEESGIATGSGSVFL